MGWEPPRNLECNVQSPTPENSKLDEGEHEQLCNAPVTIEHFGGKAGALLHDVPQVKISEYTHYSVDVEGSVKNPWAPFNSQMDWEVAQWAKLRGPGLTAFTDLLMIEGNSVELNKIIDTKIPSCQPRFVHHKACVAALYSDPEHAQYLSFAPERHYADADKTQCLYHDLCTGEWWWATQVRQILLVYLPTTRLTQITNKASQRCTLANLFHACMSHIVEPLKSAGVDGMVLMSGDGITQHCHPIFATFCLVTGIMNGDCPVCTCPHNELGKHPSQHELRDLNAILDTLELLGLPLYTQACHDLHIKPLQHPFWEDLPYLNIFQSITPDILHQLYQGVMKHMISWVTEIVGAAKIDAQKGIMTLSHVSGVEHKQMSHFLLGLIIDVRLPGNAFPARLVRTTRSLLDFLYLTQFPVHSNSSIDTLETTLDEFHANKGVFEDLGIRNNFNIPKLHFLQHYARSIKLFGMTDNFNMEATERLHIDFAKDAYAATNHKDEFWQMTKFIVQYNHLMLSFQQIEDHATNIHLPCDSVPVFHHIKFWNNEIHATETLDSVHAQPAVRIVFSLPQMVVKQYFNPQNPPPQHLAYVEWFSAFSPLPDTHSGLYKVRQLVRDGECQVSIVPWGGAVPAEWMSLEVLDTCATFFLNVFKDMYTYFNVG
ncbi:hypothetical protein BDR06DRAFT_990636 [Suillus hirtellus]|nr:hypothetical protein BDR06DRAFT_990636 [Suillus hirtellus]